MYAYADKNPLSKLLIIELENNGTKKMREKKKKLKKERRRQIKREKRNGESNIKYRRK